MANIIEDFIRAGNTFVPSDAKAAGTPQLVTAFAGLKVWFAVNEVTGPVAGGSRRHAYLGIVVNELRNRGVLD